MTADCPNAGTTSGSTPIIPAGRISCCVTRRCSSTPTIPKRSSCAGWRRGTAKKNCPTSERNNCRSNGRAIGDMGTVGICRFERKYVVSENAAEAIRSFVTAYLPIDKHVTPDQPRGYRVTSLYLDTPSFDLYFQSCHGIKNRYKLRMRFYDTGEDSPVFLEIKQRTTEAVQKMRSAVTRRA